MAPPSIEADLKVKDTIRVLTQNGECLIEYCLGDICELKVKNKVDVLLVSAFHENYQPVRNTLIGALKEKLKLSVEEVAMNKAEDLRQYYSCWISKPLPKHLPFRQLLCFEPRRLRSVHPKEFVGDVFRCLVPVLNNESGTVITPILSTGQLGFEETAIIESMVEAAVNWMKTGLPLKKLKIVQYALFSKEGVPVSYFQRNYDGVSKVFGELKERYDMQYLMPKVTPIEYDVYISCSTDDNNICQILQEELKKAKSDIRVLIGSEQKMKQTESWQEDMYAIMMKCAKVVTVLSPRYFQSSACIEQYNIALCCNRKAHVDLLAPFYIEEVPELPSYMQLVQYIDCMPLNVAKISDGCKQLIGSLASCTANLHSDVHLVDLTPVKYDVFLSYSHADTTQANQMVQCFQEKDPRVKVFFDIQEIKQGKAWQRDLYHSIDGTVIFVALVSENYLKSAVCNEEFSLALAKFWSKGDPLQLIVVRIEDIESIPKEYKEIPTVNAVEDFSQESKSLCSDIVKWLKNAPAERRNKNIFKKTKNAVPDAKEIALNLDEETSKLRKLSFKQRFPNYNNILEKKGEPCLDSPQAEGPKCDIALSFNKLDQKYANYILSELQKLAPSLKVESTWEDNKVRLGTMETADRIITLLSPNYLESPEQVEEFHIAVWRQRISQPSFPILYPIQLHTLPQRPTYFHIIPFVVNLEDKLWMDMENDFKVTLPQMFSKLYCAQLKKGSQMALDLVISDLIQLANKQRSTAASKPPSPRPSLVNIATVMDEIEQLQSQGSD
ncbi:hypothetical protein HOLleu_18049 [Holothuria leucospilota]|uniref:ADP-ribosyl cyclase/cyclic ADP-ribose hydrolase n=1 Tax=Holothuria leucospilota TaxID=206669 RepID=A0A9Q1C2J2_HOLLE|nr:hypothetical protein HOLleu_18049 [Holothuria leucospilota]